MKLVIRPIQDPHRELDVTHRLVSAIAAELWRLYGGNEELNWLEAELHLGRMVAEARADAIDTQMELLARDMPRFTRTEPHTRRPRRIDYPMWPELDRNTPRSAGAARREANAVGLLPRKETSVRT